MEVDIDTTVKKIHPFFQFRQAIRGIICNENIFYDFSQL